MADQWERDSRGFDRCQVGRYTVIVWTGSPAADLDDGFEVCEAYIPTTDRQYPDGLMIIGRRRLSTKDRDVARATALDLLHAEIADRKSAGRAA